MQKVDRRRSPDLTGSELGEWTVLRRSNGRKYLCVCSCGIEKEVDGTTLRKGLSKSCGCKVGFKHGQHDTRIYRAWKNMKSRCNNANTPKYKNHGGKGVKVCDEWENSFTNFYTWSMNNGYTNQLTIDRIDGDGNYEPGNCRWVTYKIQNNNTAQNNKITYKGVTMTASQWSEKLGMNYNTLTERIRRGWTVERAFEQKVKKKGGG